MKTVAERVRLLDALCAHAWPAGEAVEADGWVLRATRGISLRANSVWPRDAAGVATIGERIERAESFYEARGLPAQFQISPESRPPGLEDALLARGYRCHTATHVMVAAVGGAGGSESVELRENPSAPWRDVMIGSAPDVEDARGRLEIAASIRLPKRFALLRSEGEPAAIGLGVVERGWVGVYAMRTHPAHRRRGLARSIVQSLLGWAAQGGATAAYLQVETDNAAAIALYRGLGFRREYGYRYCGRQ